MVSLMKHERPRLYNLASDVAETTNVAPEQTELVGELTAAWDSWEADVNSGFVLR